MLILAVTAYLAEILPIVFYLVFLKRNKGEGLWVIFIYSILSFLTEVLYGATHGNPLVFSCFVILQFTLFSYFVYSSLKGKWIKYIPIVGGLIFYGFDIFYFTNEHFFSLAESLESVLAIPYCILLLYQAIRDSSTVFVYHNKKFWVIIAFFLYFSATLFLYIYFSTLTDQERITYSTINNFFEILKNILFSVSFIMKKPDKSAFSMDRLET